MLVYTSKLSHAERPYCLDTASSYFLAELGSNRSTCAEHDDVAHGVNHGQDHGQQRREHRFPRVGHDHASQSDHSEEERTAAEPECPASVLLGFEPH